MYNIMAGDKPIQKFHINKECNTLVILLWQDHIVEEQYKKFDRLDPCHVANLIFLITSGTIPRTEVLLPNNPNNIITIWFLVLSQSALLGEYDIDCVGIILSSMFVYSKIYGNDHVMGLFMFLVKCLLHIILLYECSLD
ncbi:hypothetical protein ACJX0J_011770, partial [Zea mays]